MLVRLLCTICLGSFGSAVQVKRIEPEPRHSTTYDAVMSRWKQTVFWDFHPIFYYLNNYYNRKIYGCSASSGHWGKKTICTAILAVWRSVLVIHRWCQWRFALWQARVGGGVKPSPDRLTWPWPRPAAHFLGLIHSLSPSSPVFFFFVCVSSAYLSGV